jgi:hypothetical protein
VLKVINNLEAILTFELESNKMYCILNNNFVPEMSIHENKSGCPLVSFASEIFNSDI